MATNGVNAENSNMSGSDDILDSNSVVALNPMVLLVRIEHMDGSPIELQILTEDSFTELCTHINPAHTLYAVEILSPHEICLTYKQGVILGHVAGELMAIESWMDFPILITVVIIKQSKVDEIIEARQKHRKLQKDRRQKEIDKLKQGQYDVEEEIG